MKKLNIFDLKKLKVLKPSTRTSFEKGEPSDDTESFSVKTILSFWNTNTSKIDTLHFYLHDVNELNVKVGICDPFLLIDVNIYEEQDCEAEEIGDNYSSRYIIRAYLNIANKPLTKLKIKRFLKKAGEYGLQSNVTSKTISQYMTHRSLPRTYSQHRREI